MNMSTRRGNCITPNNMTETQAKLMTGMIYRDCPSNIIERAAQKAIIMDAIEKKRVESPIIIFVGKDLRKSSSA